jgi:hypothetical protein
MNISQRMKVINQQYVRDVQVAGKVRGSSWTILPGIFSCLSCNRPSLPQKCFSSMFLTKSSIVMLYRFFLLVIFHELWKLTFILGIEF